MLTFPSSCSLSLVCHLHPDVVQYSDSTQVANVLNLFIFKIGTSFEETTKKPI